MNHIENIQEISLEGFQVVKGEMFRRGIFRPSKPTASIWPTSICFSKAALTALNNCERIRIEVNSVRRCILIVPVTEMDKDSVRWMKNGKDCYTRKMDCPAFTAQLYSNWGWQNNLAYKAVGNIVTSDRKVMIMFDFNDPITWEFKEKAKAN